MVGNRRIKTNAEDGCTGPMARNGSVTRFVIWMVNKVYQRDGALPVETRQAGGVAGPSLEGVRPQLLSCIGSLTLCIHSISSKQQQSSV